MEWVWRFGAKDEVSVGAIEVTAGAGTMLATLTPCRLRLPICVLGTSGLEGEEGPLDV